MAEIKLRKHQYIPFINTGTVEEPNWARIDKSTIFSLNPNPQTTTQDYIAYETPIEEIETYQPELPQEIALYENNPVYDFMFDKFFNLPVGSEAKVPVLLCFAGTDAQAWQIDDTTVVLGELNTVDGKLSFTLRFGGDIQRGTYVISDGKPTFTEASAASY